MDHGMDARLADIVMALAERELYAFSQAVARCYGAEHAAVAANDWIHEFVMTRQLPATETLIRQISQATAERLASRVVLPSLEKHSC